MGDAEVVDGCVDFQPDVPLVRAGHHGVWDSEPQVVVVVTGMANCPGTNRYAAAVFHAGERRINVSEYCDRYQRRRAPV